MRQFLNCGIKKKKDAMQELKLLQQNNNSKMDASFKKSIRSGSLHARRRSTVMRNEPVDDNDFLREHAADIEKNPNLEIPSKQHRPSVAMHTKDKEA